MARLNEMSRAKLHQYFGMKSRVLAWCALILAIGFCLMPAILGFMVPGWAFGVILSGLMLMVLIAVAAAIVFDVALDYGRLRDRFDPLDDDNG